MCVAVYSFSKHLSQIGLSVPFWKYVLLDDSVLSILLPSTVTGFCLNLAVPWFILDEPKNSSTVAWIRYSGNVFTEPLPRNDTVITHADTQIDWRNLWIKPLKWAQMPWYKHTNFIQTVSSIRELTCGEGHIAPRHAKWSHIPIFIF
jgi:hypothetical protein